ncbi:MAG TPA: IS1182 family transposase, partial [Chloroflexota bacterium]|nr:IS1182 family transposase [Chloroflexota bacterium]
AKGCYASIGRPRIDPIVFFKLQLIMFFEGLRSERRLIETAHLNLAHRWYLGYHLDEPLPDHSSLTKIRQRLGRPLFRRFFEHIVDLCRQAGLVWGQEVLVDATKARANADLDSLVPRLAEVVDEHLVALFGEDQPPEDTHPPATGEGQPDQPRLLHAPAARTLQAHQPTVARRWDVLETCRLDPQRPLSPGYQRLSARKLSRTDPDATPMTPRGGGTALGYQAHYLVDGGRARIILHVLVTPADVMENQPFLDQFRRTCFRHQLRPRRVIADTAYGTIENIRALEAEDIQAFMPLPDWDKHSAVYGAAQFTYDAAQDVYHCPNGALLRRYRTEHAAEKVEYRADAAICNACPVKTCCTTSRQGRQLHRSFYAEHLERVRGYHGTAAYQKAMRKRSVWVEPLFAEAKQWHGLRQFRLRGLANVNMEGLLIAAGQNLKRWLAATGWGRRHGPAGSLAAVFPPFALANCRSSG